MPAYIEDSGCSRIGRREEGLLELVSEAARDIDLGRIDAVVAGSMAPERLEGIGHLGARCADTLGIDGAPTLRVECGPASGSMALHVARCMVLGGSHDRVAVIAGERMTAAGARGSAAVISGLLPPWEMATGATLPATMALALEMFRERNPLPRETLDAIIVKNRENAMRNPNAHRRRPVDPDTLASSPFIAPPLRTVDCCPVSDGAVVMVVSRDDSPGNVRILGHGWGTDTWSLTGRDDIARFPATRRAIRMARDQSPGSPHPRDIDVMELHEAFSPLEVFHLVELGVHEPGSVARAIESGDTALGGNHPVNTSGGLLSRGHPVGATGLAEVHEVVEQLTGRAGDRQVDGASTGLALNFGGFGNFVSVSLFGK